MLFTISEIRKSFSWKERELFFFYQGFLSQILTIHRTAREGRGHFGTFFYSTLPLPPAHEHWDIYLQLCMWHDYHIFLIATLVFTRLLLDEIYHLIELPFEWLIDDCLFTWWIDTRFLLQRFDIGNRWIWTRIDYHPCITSKPTKNFKLSYNAIMDTFARRN